MAPIRILLQTTITPTEDDWHIGRFSMLRDHLASLKDADGAPLTEVTARDRSTPGGVSDPMLAHIDTSDFDQLWLFAVDVGDGLDSDECAAIGRFRARGGAVMATRDHMDLGVSLCTLGGVGKAHHFHSRNPNPDPARRKNDDTFTAEIGWPNYHSGANGDVQEIRVEGLLHPLLRDPADPSRPLRWLPAHPHEGDVSAPADEPDARVIATGRSQVTGAQFNLAVAFEGHGGEGRGVAQSTFHHFCDYNWDTAAGCPSFVSEPPGKAMARDPEGLRQVQAYVANMARWLSARE